MIEEGEFGGFTVYCDFCSNSDDIDEETWSEMIDAIKADGWHIFKQDGEWRHECPYCVTES